MEKMYDIEESESDYYDSRMNNEILIVIIFWSIILVLSSLLKILNH